MTESLLEMQDVARGIFLGLQEKNGNGTSYFQRIPNHIGVATVQPLKDFGDIRSVSMIDYNGTVKLFFFGESRPANTPSLENAVVRIEVGQDSGSTKLSHPSNLPLEVTEQMAPVIKGIGILKEPYTCPKSLMVSYQLTPSEKSEHKVLFY